MRPLKRFIGTSAFWLGLPLLYIYLLRGERTRVLLRYGDEVLVLKGWLGTGSWMLPGGGIHEGEEPMVAALRELKEETGIVLKTNQLIYQGKHWALESSGLKYTYHLFIGQVDERFDLTLQDNEISDGKWVNKDELLADYKLARTTRHILETWFKR